MLSITALLLIAAFIICILSAMGKAPLWVAVLLLTVVLLLQVYPK